jgi:2-aminoadipate transaminase
MYREKRDLMLDCFRKVMPEGITWTEPEGGLFLFLNLPEHMDATELFQVAINKKVAFVVGQVFHCDGSGKNTMRLNFSFATKEQIVIGVNRLAEAINEQLNN